MFKNLPKFSVYGFIGSTVACIILVLSLTSSVNLPEVADHFLTLLSQKKTEEAYQLTSKKYQSEKSFTQFQTFVAEEYLDRYQSASWNFSGISFSSGYMIGTLKLASGYGSTQLQFEFVKEADIWKVDAIGEPDRSLMNSD